jgi:Cu/Ag efflux pump CusA
VRGTAGIGGAAGRHIVGDAARERAVPLTQSVLATAAAVLPAAILGTRAGLEFLHPLAVTMLGGLASLLLVQVFVLPAFLLATARQKQEPAPEKRDAAGPPDVQHAAAAPG